MQKANIFIILISVLILSGCQTEDGHQNSTTKVIDSIDYAIVTRQKEIGNCTSENSQCAKVLVQSIDIKSGVSDKTAVSIELDVLKEIYLIEGNEASSARTIEDMIDLLIEEYHNLISAIKDYNLPWEVTYKINVINNNSGLFTVEIESYSYRGGAHGNDYVKYINYSLFDGSRIPLDSAFTLSKEFLYLCEGEFRKKFRLDSKASLNELGFNFTDDKFIIPDNYYIKQDSLFFVYNRYDIAPYSEDKIILEIPLPYVIPFIKSEIITAFVNNMYSTN